MDRPEQGEWVQSLICLSSINEPMEFISLVNVLVRVRRVVELQISALENSRLNRFANSAQKQVLRAPFNIRCHDISFMAVYAPR